MTEKIKIYLPQHLKDTLIKDALNFGFVKSDGSVNLNRFINTLIANYYEHHHSQQQRLNEELCSLLEKSLSLNDAKQLSETITYHIQHLDMDKNAKTETTVLSFKPTKNAEAAVAYIEQTLLFNHSISSYYGCMFASYASLPQDKRELILFKELHDKIQEAIQKHCSIVFTLHQGKDKYIAAPYQIAASPEEMHNYVLAVILCYSNEKETKKPLHPVPFRLSKLERLSIHNEIYKFSDQEKKVFSRALRNGVQFIYHTDDQLIQVRLKKPYGENMFQRFYVHRPLPIKIEENCYTFDCSYDQCINYFARFGSNAIIETPLELKKRMEELHYWGAKANQTSLKKPELQAQTGNKMKKSYFL